MILRPAAAPREAQPARLQSQQSAGVVQLRLDLQLDAAAAHHGQVVRADSSPGEAGAAQSRRAARGLGFYFSNLTGAVDVTTVRALGVYFSFLRPTAGTPAGVVFHVDRAET